MKSKITIAAVTLAGAALFSLAGPAQANIYNNTFGVTAIEGLSPMNGFDTKYGNPFSGSNTASAKFTYSGPLNFSNLAAQNSGAPGDTNASFGFTMANVTKYSGKGSVDYSGSPVADFKTEDSFLTSSASAGGYKFGTYMTFDLGNVKAGTVLTITHDDGISLFQDDTQIGSTTSGPTAAITESVTVTKTGDTILRYSRQNGTPSVLKVEVPEPMSMALLGAGLAGLGLVRRLKTRAA